MVGGEVAVGGGGGEALARDVAVTRVLYRAVDLNISQLVSGGHIFFNYSQNNYYNHYYLHVMFTVKQPLQSLLGRDVYTVKL